MAEAAAHVMQRLELLLGDAEWQHARAVIVDDCIDLRPRLVDRTMDEAFEIGLAVVFADHGFRRG